MKSTEVYKILREEIGPWAKTQGFKRLETMLSWSRPHAGNHLVFWFQISRDGWNDFAGSKFTLEFQISQQPVVGAASVNRKRFGKLLDESALEELRRIQNLVIGSLKKPSDDYFLLQGDTREWYLQKFQFVGAPYSANDDVWMHYHTAEHIRSWSRFVLGQLPRCLEQVEKQN